MKPIKKNEDCSRPKTVSFRLPESLMEELRILAKLNRRTLSGEVQIALETHLHNHESSSDEKPSKSKPWTA
jgi:predicted DNA-binding protein